MTAVLVANGLGASLMVLVLLGRHTEQKNRTLDGRIFNAMCGMTLCLCLLETYTFWVDGKQFPGARVSALLINALVFGMDIFFAFIWTCYTDYKLLEDKRRIKTVYPLVGIPAFVIALLCVVNIFRDVFFSVSQDNIYSRCPGAVIVYLGTYVYLVYGAVNVVRHRRRVEKYLFMPVLQFLVPIFVGSVIQLLHYGIALIWASVALGMTSLCMNLQNEESYIDSLTRLYNRNYLTHYLSRAVVRAKQGIRIRGMMLDINSFKKINDTYGHDEGDRMLQGVGKVLLQSVSKGTIVARYGGDEFVILLEDRPENEPELLLKRIQENLDRYNGAGHHPDPVSLSVGMADFTQNSVEQFMRTMDQRMYAEKRAYYRRKKKQKEKAGAEGHGNGGGV